VHGHAEGLRQDLLGLDALVRVSQAHLQGAGADRGLELAGGAFGDEAAVVDDGDPVGELVGLLQVLGGQQHRGAAGGQRANQFPDLVAAAGVQPGGGLVQEQQLGDHDDAGGDVQAAAHAPRVGVHQPPGRLGQAEGVQQLTGPRPGLAPREAQQPAQQHQVFPAGQILVDRGVLAGQGNPAAHRVRLSHHVVAEHPRVAGVGAQQGGQHPDDGGLAGAVGPQHAVDHAGGHGQVDPVDGLGLPEGLDQA